MLSYNQKEQRGPATPAERNQMRIISKTWIITEDNHQRLVTIYEQNGKKNSYGITGECKFIGSSQYDLKKEREEIEDLMDLVFDDDIVFDDERIEW